MSASTRRRRETATQRRATQSFSNAMIAMDDIIRRSGSMVRTLDDPSTDGIPLAIAEGEEEDSLVTEINVAGAACDELSAVNE